MKEYVTELQVDNKPVELNHFASQFVAHTVVGASSSLRGVDDVKNLEVTYGQNGLALKVNGGDIPLSDFPSKIIGNTLKALLSSLKGVTGTDDFRIEVRV